MVRSSRDISLTISRHSLTDFDPARLRLPLSLWISFDDMKTWPYQRVVVKESADGPNGRLNYPDGFVSRDRRWLYFAYDDNRHRAVLYAARLPSIR